MGSSIDRDLKELIQKLIDAEDNTLSPDELKMKRNTLDNIQWFLATFNNDAAEIRDETGRIIAYKGHSFKE